MSEIVRWSLDNPSGDELVGMLTDQKGKWVRFDDLAALTSRWTDEKPDREGLWWHRDKAHAPRIIELEMWGHHLCYVIPAEGEHDEQVWRVDQFKGQWSDRPISEPEEGK